MSGRIYIYNMLGVEQTSMQIKENSINKITLNVPTGYYIIKILSNKDIVTQKVLIH
jgi:hypothetical protein